MTATRDEARRAATWRVARVGLAAATHLGFACVVERSPGSESVYLHTRRGGVWWGVRVSCHAPSHECCFDYQQLLVQEAAPDGPLPRADRRIVAMVTRRGEVVADPAEVAGAIERLARALVDGRPARGADGSHWRWSDRQSAWVVDDARNSRVATPSPSAPPSYTPRAQLSARVRCQVRHAANVAARWAWELEGVALAGIPKLFHES